MPKRFAAGLLPIAVGAAVALAHLPEFLHRLLDGDEAIYGSIAVLMNMGGDLYGPGGVDNKPPGVFWVYALTFRLSGAYQMTEILMMLPLVASTLFMLRRRWFWAGVLVVVAGAFRQSAAVNVLLLLVAVFWLEPAGDRGRALILLAAGGTVALLAGAAVIQLTSSLTGFWRWTIQTLTGYASLNLTPGNIWLRARDSLVPFVLDMAVMWIAAGALATRWRDLDARSRLMVLWLVVAMAGSFAGGHLSWHYFIQAMGALAVVAAIAFVRFRPRRWISAAAVAGILIPVTAWWVFDVGADPLTYDFASPPPQHAAVAAYIASHTSPADRVFVWGDWPALYVESDRVMASRFPGFLRGFARGSDLRPDNWDTAPDVWPLLEADLRAHPPALIVDTSAAGWSDFTKYPMAGYPVLADLVASGYHRQATVDG